MNDKFKKSGTGKYNYIPKTLLLDRCCRARIYFI